MHILRAAALLLGLFSATLAYATAQSTFVTSTGSDANTAFKCSIVKPYDLRPEIYATDERTVSGMAG
jgi:hypothetical protein